MTDGSITRGDAELYWYEQGSGPAVVFSNSLGTNMTMWDDMIAHLPEGLRIIRYDKRGHGKSSVPASPYTMGGLVSDVEAIVDHLKVQDCVFVGLSVGGLIGQGLAAKRPDLIRALVLSNTGAKIGTHEIWKQRIDAIAEGGMQSVVDPTMERWFSKSFRESDALEKWRDLFLATPPEGYIGCSHAISGTDFYTPTANLRIPAMGIAGSEDAATPPDLVRETINLIPGSSFHLIRGCGHLPCVEQPKVYADLLIDFLKNTDHI